MANKSFETVGSGFSDTGQVPKDRDLFYRCGVCGSQIPSVPKDNVACECGNIYIDKDMWRLVVERFDMFSVVKRLS